MATRNIDQQDPTATADDSNEEEEELDDSSMSLVEHLEELRWRVFKSFFAIEVFGITAFIFHTRIMTFLALPLPTSAEMLTTAQLFLQGLCDDIPYYLLNSILTV